MIAPELRLRGDLRVRPGQDFGDMQDRGAPDAAASAFVHISAVLASVVGGAAASGGAPARPRHLPRALRRVVAPTCGALACFRVQDCGDVQDRGALYAAASAFAHISAVWTIRSGWCSRGQDCGDVQYRGAPDVTASAIVHISAVLASRRVTHPRPRGLEQRGDRDRDGDRGGENADAGPGDDAGPVDPAP